MEKKSMKCPDCGAQDFYVKDPDDQYNIMVFSLKDGEIVYPEEFPEPDFLKIEDETETFCERCAWHDKFKILK